MTAERDELFAHLGGPADDETVAAIRARPEWMQGEPPVSLICGLEAHPFDAERPLFRLARDWERGPMARALWRALKKADTARARAELAWLLKEIPGKDVWALIAEAASDPEESLQVRVFLLDALDRLAFGGAVGWNELGPVIERCRGDSQPAIRERAPGMLMSLPRSDAGTETLLSMLGDEHPSVLTAALQALHSLGVRSDDERLLGLASHPRESIRSRARRLTTSAHRP
jgi:hypothetical protein